jgi:hypothetical protein
VRNNPSQTPLTGPGIAHERRVLRDPHTGRLSNHPSYEGWAPSDPRPGAAILLIVGKALLMAGFLLLVSSALWHIPG